MMYESRYEARDIGRDLNWSEGWDLSPCLSLWEGVSVYLNVSSLI